MLKTDTEAGTYDYDIPTGNWLNGCKTFSINIFQWVWKVNGNGLKRTACKYRIKGTTFNREAVLKRAEDVCKRMNSKCSPYWVWDGKQSETVK